ncbi:isocitrate lyase/phosphoenolpyruvate mutase family protein [Paracoccus caeni]|uniref:Isocitrate lyase/phosphoenolpyruvate mutase family protein n=1 Tax=Paracoccus caeni TaxID=657651 RepID=A0A934VX65_9RHOB|nr:isocitrate lyase/phosphoenolpyruvate mutase family protein [Paracoccus caeni]MBK4214667.1 isocitrate lyase/phosphoenolpyruvate mutase family protein [Paracoccus caeni]
MQPDIIFRDLHQPGNPLVLINIWDAGSAKAVAGAGAKALATGSASVAGALGFGDGQEIPLDLLLLVIERIRAASDLPLSVDFEAGYADDPAGITANAKRLEALGVAGVNLEDGIPPENGIRPAHEHAARIAAITDHTGIFVNARTDLFLQNPAETHADLIADALARAAAYAEAGAGCFFAPGLADPALIGALTRDCPLPVNIMASPKTPPLDALARLNVARVSHGPFPWRAAMAGLASAAEAEFRILA